MSRQLPSGIAIDHSERLQCVVTLFTEFVHSRLRMFTSTDTDTADNTTCTTGSSTGMVKGDHTKEFRYIPPYHYLTSQFE
jgi:hypothetical protein